MGYAASKPSDCFKFLRLKELGFQSSVLLFRLLRLRDVGGDLKANEAAGNPSDSAIVVQVPSPRNPILACPGTALGWPSLCVHEARDEE